ncbi:MAG: hypothetical protein GYA51_11325 [Candidatus Methanofastidiosa archaeon]|jgi:hypothetical protein|nr:hypothetical protein [Candidatus Methanofastidiosa archaeon]
MSSNIPNELIKNLLLEIICAIDSKEYNITIKEIEDQIEANTLMQFLEKNVSVSILTKTEYDAINEHLKNLLNATKPRIEKYWGVRNSGLCFLASLIVQDFWK